MTTRSVPERRSPAFQFYPADFLVGTATFSLVEVGAYITLLCYQWDLGSIPDDAAARARLLKCSQKQADTIWLMLRSAKFQQGSGGEWRNARLESERQKQADFRARQAENGKRGGRPTTNPKQTQTEPKPNPSPNPNHNPEKALLSSSSSSSSTQIPQRAEVSGPRAIYPARRHGLPTLHRSGHQTHAFCSERMCVPDFQHAKFVGAIGGQDAASRLLDFYAETVAGLPDSVSIDPDPLKFWPPRVTSRWPPEDASVGTRTAALQRATAEFLRGGAK